MKKIAFTLLLLCLLCSAALAEETTAPSFLRVENGMLQPVLRLPDLRDENYTNEGSDVLYFCVWVETDFDTDLDGKADLVKTLVEVPRAAAEGKYKAGTIYDPLPYAAGTVERYINNDTVGQLYTEEVFDYAVFYRECSKREPAGSMTTLEAAAKADPNQWNYTTPDGGIGFSYANELDYYLARGFAVVNACGIGTYGSEGFELCGSKLERDSHKAVVEWLTGDRRAFTDDTSNIEIAADWSNGNVAMTGVSYGGTIPFEVAVTGVKGLKTIVPFAGIASWYDYTNSQGIPIRNTVNYVDYLAGYNAGGTFLNGDWDQPNPVYGSWLWTIAKEQDDTNGDYADVWERMDYTTDEENHIECSALVVTGMNDLNVTTRHAALMVEAFQKAGKTVKLVLHQGGHTKLDSVSVNGTVWEDIMNKWLSHYLFDIENDAESLPAVMAQNNITGDFDSYDVWPGGGMLSLKMAADEETTTITSEGIGPYSQEYQENRQNNLIVNDQEDFYSTLPEEYAAVYRFDVPAGTTIQGMPQLHVLLDSDREDLDGLMITAVLMDVSDNGGFKAFMPKAELDDGVETEQLDQQTYAVDLETTDWPMIKMKQEITSRKAISFAWTDLQNPGCGADSSEYVLQFPGLISGVEQEYTFVFLPTVYTVAEGHHLEVILLTWDPYRVYLDELYNLDGTLETELDDTAYQMIINNGSLELCLPTGEGDPGWMEKK